MYLYLYNRLQGIVASMSRIPTFRRRFQNLVKLLYIEAMQTGLLVDHAVGLSNSGRGSRSYQRGIRKDEDTEDSKEITHDIVNAV